MPKKDDVIIPIDADFDEVAESIVHPAPSNVNKIKQIGSKESEMTKQPATSKQFVCSSFS